ncbi:hypothetical protein [Gordonia sp. 'Campus']|uniref:hypothetical protein n=1 Tax=Gordonia sp. 'Campus' TaxID=2915824 RepID=UPI001EE3A94A|nr:hypothetical protein [Gordonia sp. 'Campus']
MTTSDARVGQQLLPSRMGRVHRRRLAIAVVVTALALLVAAVAGFAAIRPGNDPSEPERAEILSATADAVGALTTFAPDDPADRRRSTDAHLADPLRLEYRNRGSDVVLPGARAAGISMTGKVIGAGLHDSSSDRAKVLVFVDQTVSGPDTPQTAGAGGPTGPSGETTSTAKWALMRKVDGNWLLSDLQPVGDVTR